MSGCITSPFLSSAAKKQCHIVSALVKFIIILIFVNSLLQSPVIVRIMAIIYGQ